MSAGYGSFRFEFENDADASKAFEYLVNEYDWFDKDDAVLEGKCIRARDLDVKYTDWGSIYDREWLEDLCEEQGFDFTLTMYSDFSESSIWENDFYIYKASGGILLRSWCKYCDRSWRDDNGCEYDVIVQFDDCDDEVGVYLVPQADVDRRIPVDIKCRHKPTGKEFVVRGWLGLSCDYEESLDEEEGLVAMIPCSGTDELPFDGDCCAWLTFELLNKDGETTRTEADVVTARFNEDLKYANDITEVCVLDKDNLKDILPISAEDVEFISAEIK